MRMMRIRTGALGFTIVELLVVIGIIGILVTLLIPAVSKVRDAAKELKTQSLFTGLAAGLETYRNATGESYPPSGSDASGVTGDAFGDSLIVQSPYTLPPTPQTIMATGANLLVWAIFGPDLLGTSGFKDVNRDGFWWDGTHSIQDCSPNNYHGLYSLDGNLCGDNTLEPLHRRFGPYMEIANTNIVTMEDYADDVLLPKNSPNQSIPMPPPGDWGSRDDYLPQRFILDGFGFPILYYKANVGASGMMVDWSNSSSPGSGVYSPADNALYTGMLDYVPNGGMDLGAGINHPLRDARAPSVNPAVDKWSDPDWQGTFANSIWDRKVTARNVPVNKDSYLLISPGADALWGTDDDLTNFNQ